ncbi:hypothetical protein FB645_003396 [Coemansia sp. IMI 203386]|nr:hypothetical protein FB645_003396 [Coemansia sp. IMI 203386]
MTSSPTDSSYSTSSDQDRFNERYHGTIQTPVYGVVDISLSPINVAFERLDIHGTSLETNDTHVRGLVARIGLTSEDGTIDYDLTETVIH